MIYVAHFMGVLCFYACTNNYAIEMEYSKWMNKQVQIPSNAKYCNYMSDTLMITKESKLNIYLYVDSSQCVGCNLKLKDWQDFADEIKLDSIKLNIFVFVHPQKYSDALTFIRRDYYQYPVCIDMEDEFNRLNHFPKNEHFRCFLLDSENRVVLIGNPVQNPKIRELYIKTISERLGVERPNDTEVQQAEYHTNMGTFPWRESPKAHFILRNTESESIEIDSIRTSCECTTAVASKTAIAEGDSSVITITYKAEQSGDFMREVYVYLHDSEPITMRIEGRAE